MNLTADGAVNNPYGLRIGPDGALYVCEIGNHRISRLDLHSQKLTSVLDGQKEPYELQFEPDSGDLLFVDMPAHSVRRVNKRTGEVSTIAGTGTAGFGGDGGPAVEAQFKQPHSIAFHPDGRLLVCDIGNKRIRRIDLKKGTIDTFADGLNGPRAIDVDKQGTLFLALREGNAVMRMEAGRFVPSVEKLSGPKGISCAPDGSLYIADTESHTIKRVDAKGVLTTVAGIQGERGTGPEGDPLACKLARPHGVHVSRGGVVYIADSESHRVRALSSVAPLGVI